MIQRKQTLFLALAVVCSIVCSCLQVGALELGGVAFGHIYNACIALVGGPEHFSWASWPLLATLVASTVVSLVNIFLFRKRKLQASLCLLSIVLLVGWYLVLAILPQSMGAEIQLKWPALLPAVSIVLVFLARKGIVADEKLVRSLDHIR